MRTIAVVSTPCSATILLMPDSKGYKPKRNENNSCGVTQQHNKLLSKWPCPVSHGPQTAGAYQPGGINGPLTKATCNID